MQQGLPPGVKYGDQTDLGAEVLGIGADRAQGPGVAVEPRLQIGRPLRSSGKGQGRPERSTRWTISRRVDRAIPSRRAVSDSGSPASSVSLNISRTRRMAILSVGIGPSQKEEP